MRRSFWVWLHRWTGLAMAGFLVVVGLTGAVLAFRAELDLWLNPELLTVAKRDAPMLDPLVLREKAQALYPDARFDIVQLHVEAGSSVEVVVQAQKDSAARPILAYFDPYTGDRLGERLWGEVSLAKKDIISFLYRLHMSLALPASTGSLGRYILGVTALVWTIDCFVSFYLTFPLSRHERASSSAKSWWSRWKPAWLIKFSAGAYRINFDIHRAFGLWTWAMLFVFAWSSVAFNLPQVYAPVMNTLFAHTEPTANMPARAQPLDNPKLDWRAARDTGRALLDEQGRLHGFAVDWDGSLVLDREHGAYYLIAHGSLDKDTDAETYVIFNADTGAPLDASWPGKATEKTGDVISRWLFMLHMARVFGIPMKVFVCAMGFVITALSITGVYIWLKKRAARKRRVGAGASKPLAEPEIAAR